MTKFLKIFKISTPIILMIGLIPLVQNDYLLTLLFVLIILGGLAKLKYTKNDLVALFFGFIIMIISESIFISTGVETFTRNSFFGLMPLWLPFLWAYGFVAIKRSIEILDK